MGRNSPITLVGDGPAGLAIDQLGNMWVANYYGNSVSEISSSGVDTLQRRLYRRRHRPSPRNRHRRRRQRLDRELPESPFLTELAGRKRCHSWRRALSVRRIGRRCQPAGGLCRRRGCKRQHVDQRLRQQYPDRVCRPGFARPDAIHRSSSSSLARRRGIDAAPPPFCSPLCYSSSHSDPRGSRPRTQGVVLHADGQRRHHRCGNPDQFIQN